MQKLFGTSIIFKHTEGFLEKEVTNGGNNPLNNISFDYFIGEIAAYFPEFRFDQARAKIDPFTTSILAVIMKQIMRLR